MDTTLLSLPTLWNETPATSFISQFMHVFGLFSFTNVSNLSQKPLNPFLCIFCAFGLICAFGYHLPLFKISEANFYIEKMTLSIQLKLFLLAELWNPYFSIGFKAGVWSLLILAVTLYHTNDIIQAVSYSLYDSVSFNCSEVVTSRRGSKAFRLIIDTFITIKLEPFTREEFLLGNCCL